ncbi:Gfo/Idh/MocA family oxidoreductase [Streptomyces sp. NPDC058086]|uniref:Gfo/Idh/MocA family oxidoreductase n=1 Tax=Streptomyces sp. NPDC058086 TaxID=3346334 RepID=UPI0036E85BA8
MARFGTGKMGADHVRGLHDVVSGARVTAVVDIEAERARTLADAIEGCTAYAEPAAAMAAQDMDAVLIASPGPAHEAALLEALGRDHHRHRNLSMPPWFTNEMLINDSVVHEMDVTLWLLDQEIAAVTVHKPAPTSHAPAVMNDPQFVLFETELGALVDVVIFALRYAVAGRTVRGRTGNPAAR